LFFSILKKMTEFGFDEQLYNKLDIWLGTRGASDAKYLSPVKFSKDANIAEEAAIAMFAACTLSEFGILRAKLCVRCPICDYSARAFYQLGEIPRSLVICDACEAEVPAYPENVRVWFELVNSPEDYQYNGSLFEKSKGNSFSFEDYDYGLCPEGLKKSPNHLIRRLASNI